MKKTLCLVAGLVILAGCVSPSAKEPEKVTVKGVEGFKVKAGGMLGLEEPTDENLKRMTTYIKTGDHGLGLRNVASKYCPMDIASCLKASREANIYVFTPFIQYQVLQDFVIACKA